MNKNKKTNRIHVALVVGRHKYSDWLQFPYIVRAFGLQKMNWINQNDIAIWIGSERLIIDCAKPKIAKKNENQKIMSVQWCMSMNEQIRKHWSMYISKNTKKTTENKKKNWICTNKYWAFIEHVSKIKYNYYDLEQLLCLDNGKVFQN